MCSLRDIMRKGRKLVMLTAHWAGSFVKI